MEGLHAGWPLFSLTRGELNKSNGREKLSRLLKPLCQSSKLTISNVTSLPVNDFYCIEGTNSLGWSNTKPHYESDFLIIHTRNILANKTKIVVTKLCYYILYRFAYRFRSMHHQTKKSMLLLGLLLGTFF